MPLFYLHLDLPDPLGYVEDPEGFEAPDMEAARAKAVSGVRAIIAEDLREGMLDLRGAIEVADAQGQVLLTLPFDQAIEILTKERP
jgi:hypothetical protein